MARGFERLRGMDVGLDARAISPARKCHDVPGRLLEAALLSFPHPVIVMATNPIAFGICFGRSRQIRRRE